MPTDAPSGKASLMMTFSNNLTYMHIIKCYPRRSTKLWPRQSSRRFSFVPIVILVPNFVPNSPNICRKYTQPKFLPKNMTHFVTPCKASPSADTAGRPSADTHHIPNACCPLFDPTASCQVPLADDLILRNLAATGHWSSLWANEELLTKVRHHCVLCHQQATSPKSLCEHLHCVHPLAWEAAQVHLGPLVALNVGHPCKACGQRGTRSHACPVLRQLALIKALQMKDQPASSLLNPEPTMPSTALLCTPVKRHKQTDTRISQHTIKHEFHPARDALDGVSQCSHCGWPAPNIAGLQRHIEFGRCPTFASTRPIGAHVPCTWDWLCNLARDTPMDMMRNQEVTTALSNNCVLCGQKLGHTRNLFTHLHHDHAPTLETAHTACPGLLDQLKAEMICCCTCTRPQGDHRCPVHEQIVLLHYMSNNDALPKAQPLGPSDFQCYWTDTVLRAKLTSQCCLCLKPCNIHELGKHLLEHSVLLPAAQPYLSMAQSPFMDCCQSCLDASHLPEFCPVALNICGDVLYNGRGTARGRLHERAPHDIRATSRPAAAGTEQKKKRGRPSTKGQSAEHGTSHQSPDTAHLEARKPVTSSGSGRSIHSFFCKQISAEH